MDTDPLANPEFRASGIFESLREALLGARRPLACAQIEVTSVCGGRCVYCPRSANAETWNARHMQAQTFAKLWPLLKKTERAHLQGWGEPLLHPRFFDFQALAHKAGCATSTTTSGLKMDRDTADKIAASGMDIIAFSLAGTDGESNSARNGVEFDKVIDGIRQVGRARARQDRPIEIHLAYLMLADRMEAVSSLPRLMDEHNIDMAVISTLDYLANPEHRELAFAPNEDKKIAKARNILAKASAEAKNYGKYIQYALPGKTPATEGCRENVGQNVYISADGDLSPCVYLNVPDNIKNANRRVFGNANNENAWDIWQKKEFGDFRKACLSSGPETPCQNCPKRWEGEAEGI